jgi:FKBP-type peptidyl-prolyl cis-trans isomerase FkpA
MNTRPNSSAATLTPFTRTTLAVLLLAAMGAAGACGDDSPNAPTPLPRVEYSQTDLRAGTGAEAVNGRRLSVHYTLWLYDPAGANGKGRQLQSSVGLTPFSFVLGAREVISGWDRGVPGMLVGGQRRLMLPPELAYGTTGNGPDIPPNQSLVFEIELLNVQ